MIKKAPTKGMRRRMLLAVSAILFIGFSAVIVQLFILQVLDTEFYQQRASGQQLRSTPIRADRGSILDRNGNVLAKSTTAVEIYVEPVSVEDEEEGRLIAQGLSEILGVDEETVFQKTQNTGSYFESIKRQVEPDVAEQVRQFAVDNELTGAIRFGEDSKRYYTNGAFLSTVLGFVGVDNQGLYGVEAYYDDYLAGTEGKIVSAKNAIGTEMKSYNYEKIYEGEQGADIVLTIDEVIQHYLEKHLETAVVDDIVLERGVAIAMDPNTGEILGMAVKGDFDPNNPYAIDENITLQLDEQLLKHEITEEEYNQAVQDARQTQWRNKAVSDPYEPGSVFKVFTAAAALEEQVADPDESYFDCIGYTTINGVKIHCNKTTGHGSQTFREGLVHSCNPVFMELGRRLGWETWQSYSKAFGFFDKTGIDLPGEAAPIQHSDASLSNPVALADASFGQTFKVTPIQMITGLSAVVNGGTLLEPHIVKQIVAADGTIIKNVERTEVRQVLSKENSAVLRDMLESVVADGENKNGYLPGYRLGGKSGTSEKLDPEKIAQEEETGETARIASYMEFGPVDDPQIVILVLLDEPQTDSKYGSVLAAPVVQRMMNDILPYLGIEPQYTEEEKAQLDIQVPYLRSGSVDVAKAELEELGLQYRIFGDGGTVIKQVPSAGDPVRAGGVVILYTEAEDLEDRMGTVPNIIGSTPKQANRWITEYGFNMKVVGSTEAGMLAQNQTPAAGEEAPLGTVITVEFSSEANAG